MRIGRALLALLALVLAGTAAGAQDVPNVISPLRVESDHNGVNLISGRMTIELPTLSVPGAPHLKFDRVQNAAPYVLSTYVVGDPEQSSHSIHAGGGASESFNCTSSGCFSATGPESVTGTGSTFTPAGRYFRQAGSGALWHFNLLHFDTRPAPSNQKSQYYASWVEYPDGEKITYSYGTAVSGGLTYYRPVALTSNLGYHIAITYHGDTFGVNEWSQVKDAAIYNSADPATPLRKFSYSGAGTTIADPQGRIYACTGCVNQLGNKLEVDAGSLQLPGEASPALLAARHATLPHVGSVTKDGVAWTYGYTNPIYQVATDSYLYDKVIVDGPDGYHVVYDIVHRGAQSRLRNVIAKSADPIARATRYEFDDAYRPTRIVFPELNEVAVRYDEYGNIVSRTTRAKPGSGLADLVETAYVDTLNCQSVRCYRPVWSRDGYGRQTDYVYNDRGQLTEQTDPADQVGVRRKTYVEYESGALSRRSVVRVCGAGTTCGTAAEIRTEYQYWGDTFLPSRERRIDAVRGEVIDTHYSYDAAGRPVSIDGPLDSQADAVYFRYDTYGRKTWEIGALAPNGLRLAKKFSYRDSDDKLVSVEEGTLGSVDGTILLNVTRKDFTYDDRRNPIREAASAAGTAFAVVDRSYDDRGRLDCEAQRMNIAAFAATPGACSLGAAGEQGPDRITRNVYDAADQLRSVIRAYGVTTQNGFPATLQQVYVAYDYTPNGKQMTVTDANGNVAALRWDGHDRQSRWVFPSKLHAGQLNEGDYEEYGYDLVGNRTSFRRRDGQTIVYHYDALGQVILKDVPGSERDTRYTYDVRGLQTGAWFVWTGQGVYSDWDGFGRLISSRTTMGGATRKLDYLHNKAGARTRTLWPDNGYVDYERDALGRITRILGNSGTELATFAYDARGRRQNAAAAGTLAGYGYDAASRLQSLTLDLTGTGNDLGLTFEYNPASQVKKRGSTNDAVFAWTPPYAVSRTYAVNGLNQYEEIANAGQGAAALQYDGNGNLATDGASTFVYDAENRLLSASGERSATLSYDPLGRLFQVSGATGAPTQFLYDGDELVAEFDGSNNLLRRYVHGSGADDPLIWYEGSGGADRRTLLSNHQGSIVAVADASGNAVTVNRYDPWGVPGAGNAGRFQYTGQAWLTELGMYHYKARIYWPTIGRFLQTDPVGYDDQINLYAYVGNDPVNFNDPDGQKKQAKCIKPDDHGCVNIEVEGSDEEKRLPSGSAAHIPHVTGRSTARNSPPQNDEDSKTCRILRRNSESTQGVLPGYVTGNKNWDDDSTLQGYRNLYQSNADQWAPLASTPAKFAISVGSTALGATPFGRAISIPFKVGGNAARYGAPAAGGVGLNVLIQQQLQLNRDRIEAIDRRLDVLAGEC